MEAGCGTPGAPPDTDRRTGLYSRVPGWYTRYMDDNERNRESEREPVQSAGSDGSDESGTDESAGGRVVLLHGFSREEVLQVMRAIRGAVSEPADVAFCMSTPVNLDWPLKNLLLEVLKEHAYLKQNPPKIT